MQKEGICGSPNGWDHPMIRKNKNVEPPSFGSTPVTTTSTTMAHGPKYSGFRAMSHLQQRCMVVAYLLVHVKLQNLQMASPPSAP